MRRGAPVQAYRSPSMTVELDDDLEGGGSQTSPLVMNMTRPPTSASQLEMSDHVSGKAKGPPRSGVARAYLTQQAPNALRFYALLLLVATLIVAPLLPIQWCILVLVFSSCTFGGIASMWLSRVVLQCDDGTAEMRAVSDPIREGASGFLRVQYSVRSTVALNKYICHLRKDPTPHLDSPPSLPPNNFICIAGNHKIRLSSFHSHCC